MEGRPLHPHHALKLRLLQILVVLVALADELEALFDLLARAELVPLLFPPDLRYPPDTAMQDTIF